MAGEAQPAALAVAKTKLLDGGRDIAHGRLPGHQACEDRNDSTPAPIAVSGSSVFPVGPTSISVPICGQTPQSKHGVHRQSSTSTSLTESCQSSHSQSLSSPESRWSHGSTSENSRSRVVYQGTSTGSPASATSAADIHRS